MPTLQPNPTNSLAFPATPRARKPSLAAGQVSRLVANALTGIEKLPPSASRGVVTAQDSVAHRLFDASAELKILVSKISMHLPDEWRRRLFRRIDGLHNPEDWEDTDIPVTAESFTSFLRFVLQVGPVAGMSIGVSPEGHFLIGWVHDKDTLTLEFAGPREVRWAVVRYVEGQRESAAGRASSDRLPEILKPFTPPNWSADAVAVSS